MRSPKVRMRLPWSPAQGKRILVGEDGKQVVVIPCGQLSPGFD